MFGNIMWEFLKCLLSDRPYFARSPQWSTIRARHLARESRCRVCDTNEGLEVHHIIPVHVDAGKELDLSNLITLCRSCHFRWGHLWDWWSWNVDVVNDANTWFYKKTTRPSHKDMT